MQGTMNVPLGRNGKYGAMTVDCDKFTPTVHDHIYTYGLRQLLNDAIADKTDDDGNTLPIDQLVAKAQKRLDTLYSGELRVSRAAEPIDPVEREAFRIAWEQIVAFLKKTPDWAETKGEKDRALATANLRRDKKGQSAATREELVDAVLAQKPEIRKAAERIVRERDKVSADIEV
jgi:hypothetical protein